MNWSSLIIGTLLFGVSAAFTRVYEWNETEFSREAPSSMVIHGDRIFFGFPINSSRETVRLAFAWLPGGNNSNLSPSLHPLQLQEEIGENCDAVQGVIDLKTDELGRLWVLDGASRNCQPTFRIFDLKDNDSLLLVHPLAGNPRNIVTIADAAGSTPVAVVSEWTGKFFYFLLNEQMTIPFDQMTDTYQGQRVEDLAWTLLSPLKNQTGYFCSYQCRQIFLADDSTTRATPTTVTKIGTLSSDSKGMLMDKKGVLYFVHETEKSVTAWDTKGPFKEELLHKFDSDVDSINFALDGADNLWLLSHHASSRFFLLKGQYK